MALPVLKKLLKTGETYIVDDGGALYLAPVNRRDWLLTTNNDIVTIGAIGEIVDLPLAKIGCADASSAIYASSLNIVRRAAGSAKVTLSVLLRKLP